MSEQIFKLTNARLRPWRSTDAESLARHANNRNIWRNLRDGFPHPYTLADAQDYVSRHVGREDALIFAIEVGGEAAGGIALHPQPDVARHSAEVGYWLGEDYWSRGIMTEAVRAITRLGFTEAGFIRLYACVFDWNPASRRVLAKAGYSFEGRHRLAVFKDSHLVDEHVYAVLRDDWLAAEAGPGRESTP